MSKPKVPRKVPSGVSIMCRKIYMLMLVILKIYFDLIIYGVSYFILLLRKRVLAQLA